MPYFFQFLTVIGLVYSIECKAQVESLHFNHLTTANGLSQSVNAFIYKDSKGFVWISSTDALNCFDGQSVRTYRYNSNQPHSLRGMYQQSQFFEDEKGNLWFCMYDVINCYRRVTDDFSNYYLTTTKGTKAKSDYYIFQRDADGYLWVKVDEELFRFLLPDPSQPNDNPRQFYMGKIQGVKCVAVTKPSDNKVDKLFSCFFRRRNGFDEYAVDERDSLKYLRSWLDGRNGRDSAFVFNILPDQNGLLWLATDQGLMRFDRFLGRITGVYQKYGNEEIGIARHIVRLDANKFFVSSNQGLWVFDKTANAFVQAYRHSVMDASSIASNKIDEIYLDPDHNLWASIWTTGVDFARVGKVKFSTLAATNFTLSDDVREFVAGALAEDADGNIWCGSNISPLRIRKKNGEIEKLTVLGKPYNARQIKLLRNKDILLSSLNDGAFRYDYRRKSFSKIITAGGREVVFEDFVVLSDQTVLGAGDDGLYKIGCLDGNCIARKMPVAQLNGGDINRVLQDNTGRLFVAKFYNSVTVFDLSGNSFKTLAEIEVNGEVKTFLETEHSVWAGGNFGLLCIKKQDLSWKIINEQNGLPNNTVYGILPDQKGYLWLSTNLGIIRFQPDSMVFRRYNLADGLQDYEFNTNSFLRTRDGEYWFGGIKGFNVFRPEDIIDIPTLPQIRITRLRVNDEPDTLVRNIAVTDSLEFGWRNSTLSFEFAAMEYSDPANNKLQYRLIRADGRPYDANWVMCETANGFARYANLPPGEYVLNIRGANSDDVWNPEPRRLYFKINPPFWKTWWFRTLCVLALAGATYASVRSYIQNKLRVKNLQLREQHLQIEKQEALTQERNRIAGEMHDDLGGGLTSIRMLSSRVQKKINSPEIQTQVDKIAQYSQELVQKMGEIIWAMNSNFDTVENLVAYIRRYAVDFLEVNGLRHHINEPEEMPDYAVSGERRRNIYLAAKESLHNIVKHAGAKRVTISFGIKGEQLTVRVQDDGKGIDLEQVNQFGNGLYNMRKRLRDVGGEMLVENYEGTLLTFIVPLEKSSS